MPTAAKLLLAISCSLQFLAVFAAEPKLELHNVEKVGEQTYRFGQPDPKLVFHFSNVLETDNQGVLLELEAISQDANKQIAGRLYWANGDHAFNGDFSFTFNFAGRSRLFFPVDDYVSQIKSLRLDIDNCECEVRVTLPVLTSAPQSLGDHQDIRPSDFLRNKFGFDIPTSDWGGQNFNNPSPNRYTYKSIDPRILNHTPLNLPLDSAGGFYAEFYYNIPRPYQQYEVFWGIRKIGWSQLRSAHFVLANSISGEEMKRVFIPFDRIYSKKTLDHLRLDFSACRQCVLQIVKTRIVGQSEIEQYRRFIPERIYYVHTEFPPKRLVLNQVIDKFKKDTGFWLIFTTLIVLTILFIIRCLLKIMFYKSKSQAN